MASSGAPGQSGQCSLEAPQALRAISHRGYRRRGADRRRVRRRDVSCLTVSRDLTTSPGLVAAVPGSSSSMPECRAHPPLRSPRRGAGMPGGFAGHRRPRIPIVDEGRSPAVPSDGRGGLEIRHRPAEGLRRMGVRGRRVAGLEVATTFDVRLVLPLHAEEARLPIVRRLCPPPRRRNGRSSCRTGLRGPPAAAFHQTAYTPATHPAEN